MGTHFMQQSCKNNICIWGLIHWLNCILQKIMRWKNEMKRKTSIVQFLDSATVLCFLYSRFQTFFEWFLKRRRIMEPRANRHIKSFIISVWFCQTLGSMYPHHEITEWFIDFTKFRQIFFMYIHVSFTSCTKNHKIKVFPVIKDNEVFKFIFFELSYI